jgi:hypothetical protein
MVGAGAAAVVGAGPEEMFVRAARLAPTAN